MADVLERYEKQFKAKELRNKRIFYDLYARVDDPEELRGLIVQLLKDMDWKVTLNELSRFEELELEGIFRGGRLKPVKALIKAYNQVIKGSKYPILWKLFTIFGLISLFIYFAIITYGWNLESNFFLYLTPILFAIALVLYEIKEKVRLAIWVKIAGIYDIQRESADLRVLIAADADKDDKEAFDKLNDDVSEFYSELNRKYVKRIREIKPTSTKVFSPKLNKILQGLVEVNKEIDKLEKKFVNGKVSESTYKELKKELQKKKEKLEMLAELYEEQ